MTQEKLTASDLTHERIKELLDYDPKTGIFRWKNVAGAKCANGYIKISVDKLPLYAHRLAWFYMTGEWPSEQVDHINGKRDDNSFANLRLASQSQNSANGVLRSNNTSGYRGVSWCSRRKKWISRIVKERKQYVLGYFGTKEEAYCAYLNAASQHHGEFNADLAPGRKGPD